jgi:hypothetical protein
MRTDEQRGRGTLVQALDGKVGGVVPGVNLNNALALAEAIEDQELAVRLNR